MGQSRRSCGGPAVHGATWESRPLRRWPSRAVLRGSPTLTTAPPSPAKTPRAVTPEKLKKEKEEVPLEEEQIHTRAPGVLAAAALRCGPPAEDRLASLFRRCDFLGQGAMELSQCVAALEEHVRGSGGLTGTLVEVRDRLVSSCESFEFQAMDLQVEATELEDANFDARDSVATVHLERFLRQCKAIGGASAGLRERIAGLEEPGVATQAQQQEQEDESNQDWNAEGSGVLPYGCGCCPPAPRTASLPILVPLAPITTKQEAMYSSVPVLSAHQLPLLSMALSGLLHPVQRRVSVGWHGMHGGA